MTCGALIIGTLAYIEMPLHVHLEIFLWSKDQNPLAGWHNEEGTKTRIVGVWKWSFLNPLFPIYCQYYDIISYELMYIYSPQCLYKPRKGKSLNSHVYLFFIFIKWIKSWIIVLWVNLGASSVLSTAWKEIAHRSRIV